MFLFYPQKRFEPRLSGAESCTTTKAFFLYLIWQNATNFVSQWWPCSNSFLKYGHYNLLHRLLGGKAYQSRLWKVFWVVHEIITSTQSLRYHQYLELPKYQYLYMLARFILNLGQSTSTYLFRTYLYGCQWQLCAVATSRTWIGKGEIQEQSFFIPEAFLIIFLHLASSLNSWILMRFNWEDCVALRCAGPHPISSQTTSNYVSSPCHSVWPEKNRQISIKVVQKWFHYKNNRFWHLYKNCRRTWDFGPINCCQRL